MRDLGVGSDPAGRLDSREEEEGVVIVHYNIYINVFCNKDHP